MFGRSIVSDSVCVCACVPVCVCTNCTYMRVECAVASSYSGRMVRGYWQMVSDKLLSGEWAVRYSPNGNIRRFV